MRYFLLILVLFFKVTPLFCQIINPTSKPIYSVFEYDKKYGIVDTLGNEVEPLGKYYSIEPFGGLTFYRLRKNEDSETKDYQFYDATKGKIFSMGELADYSPVYSKGDSVYFHLIQNNKSVLQSPLAKQKFTFDKRYLDIKKITLYDTIGDLRYEYFITEDNTSNYSFWSKKDSTMNKITTLPKSDKYEIISSEVKEGYSTYIVPIGIAFRVTKPQNLKVTEEEDEFYAAIYNHNLVLKGKGFTGEKTLTKLFKRPSYSRSGMGGSVSAGSGILRMIGNDQSVDLNEHFAIKRMIKGNYENYYFATKQGDKYTDIIKLQRGEPYFVYHKNQKLLQLRLYDYNRLSFIFDYDGILFPKGKIMIPKSYLEKEKLSALLPYSL